MPVPMVPLNHLPSASVPTEDRKQAKGLGYYAGERFFSLPLRPRVSTSFVSSPIPTASMAEERKCEGYGDDRPLRDGAIRLWCWGPCDREEMNLWGKFRTNRVCDVRNIIICHLATNLKPYVSSFL